MSVVRWLSNQVPQPGAAIPRLSWRGFALVYFLGFAAGLIAQVLGLAWIEAGQGGVILVFDLILIPCIFPIAAKVVIPAGQALTRKGRFGLLLSSGLCGGAILAPAFLAIILLTVGLSGLGGGAGLWSSLLLSLNFAVTYGLPIGAMSWLRLASENRACYLTEISDRPNNIIWFVGIYTLVLAWQWVFWRLPLA